MANAQTVVVGTVVTDVFPSSYGAALTVQNSGTVTVFLGDATGMNVATGFPLSPGSTIVWDAGRPLYAVVASGTGQVTVLANSGNLNDVSAIATAIIDAGLANDIASAISIAGVPIIDDPAVLLTIPSQNIDTDPILTTVDVSRYQSVALSVTTDTESGHTPTFPIVNVVLSFQDANDNPMGASQASLIARNQNGTTDTLYMRVPALGSKVTLLVAMQSGHKLGASGYVEVNLTGSYRPLDDGGVGSNGSTLYDAMLSGYVSGVDSYLAAGLTSFWVPNSTPSYSSPGIVYPTWRNGTIQFTLTGQLTPRGGIGRDPRIVVQDALNSTVRYKKLSWSSGSGDVTLNESFTLNVGYRAIALLFADWRSVSGDEVVISMLYDPL